MTQKELTNLFNTAEGFDYGSHEPLMNLSCVFENDTEQFEVTFAVPQYWLLEQTKLGTLEKLQHWLCNEYTSDDSREILDKAIEQNKIAFWKIN